MQDLQRIRKVQLHSSNLRSWNHRGVPDFANFYPSQVLTGDLWRCNVPGGIVVNGLAGNITLYKGDLVLANVDNPGELSWANINKGSWEVIRKSPIGFGSKQSGVDGGCLGEASVDDDYYYICVFAGDHESLPGRNDGTATWKKIHLLIT